MIVAITTYNRPHECQRLVRQIGSGHHIRVYDDCSPQEYPDLGVSHYDRRAANAGKFLYWRWVDHILKDVGKMKPNYFIMLPDDVTVVPGFVDKALALFKALPNPDGKTVALNLLLDARTYCWTGYERRDIGPAYQTQWVDLAMICNATFLRVLGPKINPIHPNRWVVNPRMSSGVGQQISTRLHPAYRMYQVKEPLVYHGNHVSLMNPLERPHNPLVT